MAESAALDASCVSGPLGSETNPVRCAHVAGEIHYLNRLRNLDGSKPAFHRVGSFGRGVYGSVIDGYEVTSGDQTVMIYMDMYHFFDFEREAVPGFTLISGN